MATTTPFNLASYEWPPHALGHCREMADNIFETIYKGRLVRIATRRVYTKSKYSSKDRRLFFKQVGEEHARIVSLPDKRPQLFSNTTKDSDETIVKRAIYTQMWGYAFLLDTTPLGVSALCWLYLDADRKTGCWTAFNGVFKPVHFQVDLNFSHLAASLNDKQSDARFALEWSQLSTEEHQQQSIRFSNGSMNELQTLVHALVLVNQPPGRRWLVFGEDGFTCGDRLNRSIPADIRFRRWALRIRNYFAPFGNSDLMERHQCVRFIFPCVHVKLPLESSTYHERLEAALFLRDWAKDKIPPDELRLLLPKL